MLQRTKDVFYEIINQLGLQETQAPGIIFKTKDWRAIGREHIRRACACGVELASRDVSDLELLFGMDRFVLSRQMVQYNSQEVCYGHSPANEAEETEARRGSSAISTNGRWNFILERSASIRMGAIS